MKSRLVLIDEDTSATNFMIRDSRMKKLVSKSKEPITPFIDKVKQLYNDYGVSSVIVAGGSGDYFKVADHVIMMDEYIPKDVTKEAKLIISQELSGSEITNLENSYGNSGEKEKGNEGDNEKFGEITDRIPLKSAFELNERRDKIKTRDKNIILYGHSELDLSGLEQLLNESQTRCLAAMIEFLTEEIFDDRTTLYDSLDKLYERVKINGLECLSKTKSFSGKLALPRKYELSAAINRYRELKIKF